MTWNIGKSNTNYFWMITGLAVIALVATVVTGLALVERFDLVSRQREQSVVENGIHGRIAEVAQMVVPQVVWDDAVEHLDNSYDPDWARQNIGIFLNQTNGFETSFVLDADNRPVFAYSSGTVADPQIYAAVSHEAGSLVTQVRSTEAIQQKIAAARHDGKSLVSAEISRSALGDIGQNVYVITATLVQPDFGTVRIQHERAPIVVTLMPIDTRFLESFADRYLLKNVEFHHGPARPASNQAFVPLVNPAGKTIATLRWPPQNPGWEMLVTFGPPTFIVMVLLTWALLALLRRSSQMTEGLIASEARATHLAYYDALTGHPNRVLFFDRLGQALRQLRRNEAALAVHCIDLDRFKEINDTFGHQVGDELIFEAAKRMANICRSSETFARLSGDEFAIVQPNATAGGAARLAARLCEAMSEPFDLGSGRVYAGCSIGITLVSDSEMDAGEALRQSDLALYRAKQTAKGQFSFFEGDMDAAARVRRDLETDLREALANEELYLAYQPQVSGKGVITGVEALIRWDHPERGLIAPSFFIPIAEQCGLIVPLGLFALRRAFEDSMRWKGLKIAINVSAAQIRMKDFIDEVRNLIDRHRVDPRNFELEITEGILLGDDPETQERLAELRAMGFSLALDDFGTGYSSLSYLQRYPIDKIKIDRSFIANLGIENEADALVGAIVKLARALKLSVIAEGVETEDQLAHLSALGCSDVQGYLFSKLVRADEIDTLFKAQNKVAAKVS